MKISFVTQWCRRLASVGASALLLTALGVMPAQAVLNDGFFELDGNVADSPAGGVDDWSNFPNAAPCGTNCTNTSHTAKATGIISDLSPAVFRGSKDIYDISTWGYDPLGNSPPKNNILHAYAAAYTATSNATPGTSTGDLLVYFGANRDSFTGTASMGFWFFKKDVVRKDATGSFVLRGTNTPATHSDGDILIAFEYNNGGAVIGVKSFRWTGEGTAGSLVEQTIIGQPVPVTGSTVSCDTAQIACGGGNNGNLPLPWNGTVKAGQFFEGGANLSRLLPGGTCFASFMATSRTSTVANATIKNFILAGFPVCHLTVSKQCPDLGVFQPGDPATILFTVKGRVFNDGGGTLKNITLKDAPTDFTSPPGFFTCDSNGLPTNIAASGAATAASLPVGAEICYSGQYAATSFVANDTVTASADGGVSNKGSAICELPQPGLALTQTCDVDLAAVNNALSLKVNIYGTVKNTGQTLLTNVQVCDTPEGLQQRIPCTVVATSLAIGETKNYGPISYIPKVAASLTNLSALLNPHQAVLNAKVTAVGSPPAIFGFDDVKVGPNDVQCSLCADTKE